MQVKEAITWIEQNYLPDHYESWQVNGYCSISCEYENYIVVEGFFTIDESVLIVGAKLADADENHQYELAGLEESSLQVSEFFDPIAGKQCVFIVKQLATNKIESADIDSAYDSVFDKVLHIWRDHRN